MKCQVKDLPEFINVDMKEMELNDVVHLSDLKLPKGVKLATDPNEGDHDHPVVSIHLPKVVAEEVEVASAEEETKETDSKEASQDDSESKD